MSYHMMYHMIHMRCYLYSLATGVFEFGRYLYSTMQS